MATLPTDMANTNTCRTRPWIRYAAAFAMAVLLVSGGAPAHGKTSPKPSKGGKTGCSSKCRAQLSTDFGTCAVGDAACVAAARVKYDACILACTKPTTTTTRPTKPHVTSTTTTIANQPSRTTTTITAPPVNQPTTTTTFRKPTTTTTTTVVVPLSPATTACIKTLTADKKICLASSAAVDCQGQYDAGFPACFAPGKGATCAAACVAKKATCTSNKPPRGSSGASAGCKKSCQTTWGSAASKCGAVPACLNAASDGWRTCLATCTNTPPPTLSCPAAFSACLTKCPNL
jgi:hypothetical protein